jgi:hypothetical protein
MLTSYRYLNSETYYDISALSMLVRMLTGNSCEEREKWWLEIRSCRRRRQNPIEVTVPIYVPFVTPTEYSLLEFNSMIDRIKLGLKDKGMLVYDAFRAFNSSNSGLLTCSELYGALDFLGIKAVPEQVYNLMRKMAVSNEGLASYEDFKRIFHSGDDEFESMAIAAMGDNNFEVVPPKPIEELVDLSAGIEDDAPVVLNEKVLKFFKLKTKPIKSSSSYNLIWNSQGTLSQNQVAVWAPSLSISILATTKVKICLGYYASRGFANPATNKEGKNHQIAEISDNQTIRMNRSKVMQAVLVNAFPFPVRFKRTWQLQRGDKTFVGWKPIPPDGFVCLGMVCTNEDVEPSLDAIRCVPDTWVKRSKTAPVKLWDDSGAGGGKPGSIWLINSYDMIAVVAGHDAPREDFYELHSSRFFLDQVGFKHATAAQQSKLSGGGASK